jgi:hypothetical protein
MGNDIRYPLFNTVIDQLVDEVQALSGTGKIDAGRRVAGSAALKLRVSISKLVSDTVSIRFSFRAKAQASIHLGKDHYKSIRYQQALSYSIHVKRAFDGMLSLEYLRIDKGGFHGEVGKSFLTRYSATPKLLSLFQGVDPRIRPVIIPKAAYDETVRVQIKDTIQKDGKSVDIKRLVDYQDNKQTNLMRTNLMEINRCLEGHWFDLNLDDESIDQVQKEMLSKKQRKAGVERQINFAKRTLYRVFNDPEFKTGGRFYGGWWQEIPKQYRHSILIDGKQTVEFDYSNLHPTFLYLQEGLKLQDDAYEGIIGYAARNNNAPEVIDRRSAKVVLNAMLNAPKPLSRSPRGFKKYGCKCTWQEMTKAVEKRHKPIAHYFHTNGGLKLQLFDSQIAERVMLKFVRKGYPVLPLHDSFLLHNGLKQSLQDAMSEAFKEVIGGIVAIDQKKPKPQKIDDPEWALFWDRKLNEEKQERENDDPITNDVFELLEQMDIGHLLRQDAFWTLMQS